MNCRLSQTFASRRSTSFCGVVPYIMAGDPSIDLTLATMRGIEKGGACALELGMPFSDPMADGPAIQAAARRSLRHDTCLNDIFTLCQQFREKSKELPIILMGYCNPVMQYGYEAFARDCATYGIDGVIIVDMPYEESRTFSDHLRAHHVHLIQLLAPTTPPERLSQILSTASGCVYNINVKGITGVQRATTDAICERIHTIKAHTSLPVLSGFGIRTPDQAAALCPHVDGVVIGSAFVEHMAAHAPSTEKEAFDIAKEFIETFTHHPAFAPQICSG